MSFLLKKDDSHGVNKTDLSTTTAAATTINKKESIFDRDSPRLMEIVIKRLENELTNSDKDSTNIAITSNDDKQSTTKLLSNNANENVLPKVNIFLLILLYIYTSLYIRIYEHIYI